MKKKYALFPFIIFLFISINSFATMHVVMVSQFQFSPSTMSVEVGDTIVWQWVNGSHTTTSDGVPANALPWSSQITAGTSSFEYPVTEPGTYTYHCIPHQSSGMVGGFFATTPNSINTPDVVQKLNLYSLRPSVFVLSYTLQTQTVLKLALYDITGKSVRTFNSNYSQSGDYRETYYLNDLQKGIYIFEMIANNKRLTKRIILE